MTDTWKPADLPELTLRLSAEKRVFEPIDHSQWAQISVTPFKARIRRSDEYGDEFAFVVARQGHSVLFFDDAEDSFSGATLDSAGWLQKRQAFGELRHAIRRFKWGAA